MTATKGFIHAAGTTALDTRKADERKLAVNAAGTPRLGLLTSDPTIVVADASTSPVRVAVKAAGIATQRQAGDGVAFWANDGSIFVNLDNAPISNSRIDVIYAKHEDAAAGDGSSLPVIGRVTGDAAPSPTKPAIPSGALELATVTIPSGATATTSGGVTIANTYPMTALRGGVVPLRSSTEQTAWTPDDGALAYRQDTDELIARVNGAWAAVAAGSTAWVAVTPESSYYNVVSNGSWQALSVKRAGLKVQLAGHISTDGNTGVDSTFAFIPDGFRPTTNTAVLVRTLGSNTFVFHAYVTPAGALVVQPNITTGAANLVVAGDWLTA